jgi:hypothetical protein
MGGPGLFFEERDMFRVQAPVIVIPTAEVRAAVGKHLRAASIDAYRAIAKNGEGLEIAHLQFLFRDRVLAVCSRMRRDGFIEIELGLGNPQLGDKAITLRQLQKAEATARHANRPAPRRS